MSKIEAKKTSKKGGQVGKKSFGRPKKEFSFLVLDQLCRIHCIKREICSFFRLDEKTLSARIMDEYGMTFSDYYEELTDDGKTELRGMQWKSARTNIAMQKWLGINILGQKNEINENNTESNRGANVTYNIDTNINNRSGNGT
jgi:hypothetical protein